MRADLDELSAVLRRSLCVGVTQVLGALDLPQLLAGFSRAYLGVTLALRTGLIARLLGEQDAGTVDVVLGPIHPDLSAKYVAEPLVPEQVVLITPPGRYSAASLAEIRDEPFVCLPEGSGLHGILLAAASGFEPRVQFQTHSAASIRELVAAGLGVALLAASAARGPGPAVDVHRLEPAPAHPPIGLIFCAASDPDLLCGPGPTKRARRHVSVARSGASGVHDGFGFCGERTEIRSRRRPSGARSDRGGAGRGAARTGARHS